MTLTFLGTRGEIDIRTPRHRFHTALLVAHRRSRIMIDCGLDWLEAMWRLRPRPTAIVLTHAHPDHAWGLQNGALCPVYATEQTWNDPIVKAYPITRKKTVPLRESVRIGGLQFEAFPVEHSIRAPAVGYRISAGKQRIFYCPDVVYIPDHAAALAGVDIYIGDGATVTRPFVRRSGARIFGHAQVGTQLTWCRKAGIPQCIITHCGREIVAGEARAAKTIQQLAAARGVQCRIANDGMKLFD